LLVNADDFGLHADIDRGILDCIERGAVQSLSFSPQGKSLDWKKVAELQRAGVKVGLHLTLVGEPWGTTGEVIAKWPQLVKWVMLGGTAARRQLDAEADWQIGQCLDNGIRPDHIDSHQHVHVFPGIWQAAMRLKREHRIPRIRVPRCPTWKAIKKNVPGVALQTLATQRALSVDHYLPCLGLARAGHNTTDVVIEELKALSHVRAESGNGSKTETIELVMHPGVNTPGLEGTYPEWQFDWTAERDALLDPRLGEAMNVLGCAFAKISAA
jgi:chitin disaccharide deacetylase